MPPQVKNPRLLPLLILIFVFIISTRSQVQIKCGKCIKSSCGGQNFCAIYYGQGFNGQEQCVKSCQGYPIVYYPSYCEVDSQKSNCSEKCCVSLGRNPTSQKNCTANLASVFKTTAYCDQILTNAMGFGIIIGSLVLIVIIVMISCVIIRFCANDPNAAKPYASQKVRMHRRNKFTIANFQNGSTWRIFQGIPLREQQQAQVNIIKQKADNKQENKMKKQTNVEHQISSQFNTTGEGFMKDKNKKRQQAYYDS